MQENTKICFRQQDEGLDYYNLRHRLNPKNSYGFFARRADELQNNVKQHVMHKIQDEPKIKHDPNLRVKYFVLIIIHAFRE